MFSSKKLWVATIAVASLGAVFVLATPDIARANGDCAEYISGGPSNPRSGSLIGTRTESITITVGVGGSGISRTITLTIGVYDMDGEDQHQEVRCDTYEAWDNPVPR